MPHYRWHLLGALFAFFVMFFLFRVLGIAMAPVVWIFSLLACVFSALAPDIDSKKSKIYKVLTDSIVVLVAILIIAYMYENLSEMLWLLLFWFLLSGPLLFAIKPKHRGFVHSIWMAAVFGFVIGMIALITVKSFVPGFFAFVGYFSHLAMDKRV